MRILSHRGWWTSPDERNTEGAMRRSINGGYGTETDVRDRLGGLVVAHDPAGSISPSWQTVVDLFSGTRLPLAVNVKADGLSVLLEACFAGTDIEWFAFDMSGPETVRYADRQLPFYTRHSNLEQLPILYDRAEGVWLDDFAGGWIDADRVARHVDSGKKVCIVSCELHGRDPRGLWERMAVFRGHPLVSLCTDRPADASGLFA